MPLPDTQKQNERIYTSSQTLRVQNSSLNATEAGTSECGIREIISRKLAACNQYEDQHNQAGSRSNRNSLVLNDEDFPRMGQLAKPFKQEGPIVKPSFLSFEISEVRPKESQATSRQVNKIELE